MAKSRKRIAQDYARNAMVDGDTKAGRYEKKMAVKEAAGDGPKMYNKLQKGPKKKDCYGPKAMDAMYNGKPGVQQDDFEQFSNKGPKMGYDHGPKMTSDPQSYRSSMAKHWHKENLLSENPIAKRASGK